MAIYRGRRKNIKQTTETDNKLVVMLGLNCEIGPKKVL